MADESGNGGSDKTLQYMGWFLAGLGVGAVVGILYAPRSGKETRESLANSAKDGADYLRDRGQKAADYASDLYDRGRGQVSTLVDKGRDQVSWFTERMQQGGAPEAVAAVMPMAAAPVPFTAAPVVAAPVVPAPVVAAPVVAAEPKVSFAPPAPPVPVAPVAPIAPPSSQPMHFQTFLSTPAPAVVNPPAPYQNLEPIRPIDFAPVAPAAPAAPSAPAEPDFAPPSLRGIPNEPSSTASAENSIVMAVRENAVPLRSIIGPPVSKDSIPPMPSSNRIREIANAAAERIASRSTQPVEASPAPLVDVPATSSRSRAQWEEFVERGRGVASNFTAGGMTGAEPAPLMFRTAYGEKM